MAILLAIKPEFVEKILSGDKKFEFRKFIPKAKVDKIYIYATRPVCRVVAVADVLGVLSECPEQLWILTKNNAGISREFFDSYFAGRGIAYAYQLGNVVRFDVPKALSEFGVRAAPQSFVYVDK